MAKFENLSNRSIIIIEPKQPFIDWLNSVNPTAQCKLGEINDLTAYLIPDCVDNKELTRFLKANYKPIFEEELFGWMENEKLWPKKRTYDMFREWFKINFHSMIYEMCDSNILKERY
ncbi:MAG: hypothetical protein ABSH12_06525 [Endomicrobiales bacterium]|jgi:hypothetical protein